MAKQPIKNSHYGMERTGNKDESKGFEYRCPVCNETMYWGEAKRHYHDGWTLSRCKIRTNQPMTGPIIFGNETARNQLLEHGEVFTFRSNKRTTGDTWWRRTRTGLKCGDVHVEEVAGPVGTTQDTLREWADKSGFDSPGDWQRAIEDVHGDPNVGWVYRVTTL